LQHGAARLRRRFRDDAVDHSASHQTRQKAARVPGGFALRLQAVKLMRTWTVEMLTSSITSSSGPSRAATRQLCRPQVCNRTKEISLTPISRLLGHFLQARFWTGRRALTHLPRKRARRFLSAWPTIADGTTRKSEHGTPTEPAQEDDRTCRDGSFGRTRPNKGKCFS
jgi:hypothetical protein